MPFSDKEDGYFFQKETLSYLAKSYLFTTSPAYPTLCSVCKYNARVCEAIGLSDITNIWHMLDNFADTSTPVEEETRRRSQSIISNYPSSHSIPPSLLVSRGDSTSSMHHANSLSDHMVGVVERSDLQTQTQAQSQTQLQRSNSYTPNQEVVDEPATPDLCNFTVHLSLSRDLCFLYDLIQEGDLLNAIAIACVFWSHLSRDYHAMQEVQHWLQCYLDLLSSEEMYEEMVRIRQVAGEVGITNKEDYVCLGFMDDV